MRSNFKTKVTITFLLFILPAASLSVATNKVEAVTRIVISTSGPVKFNSYWLENPPRLVVEFQSKNVVSKIDNKVAVNQGVIKKITSSYFEGGEKKSLKSLIFELAQKASYEIQQENDSILIDIEAPFEGAAFSLDSRGVITVTEADKEKLKAMDLAFIQAAEKQIVLETPEVKAIEEGPLREESIGSSRFFGPRPQNDGFLRLLQSPQITINVIFQTLGLILASGLGFLLWRRYRLILDENMATQEIAGLKLELEGKNKLLEQEEIIRKTIETASLVKEKECEQVKNSFESLREVLVKKGLAKKLSSPEEDKEEFWITGKSQEKRQFPRLDLNRNYNRTIILRIESHDKSKSIKSFANNISSGGLCFETRNDFKENEMINLRLFFFGDNAPIMKIKAEVIWKKAVLFVNNFGVSFVSLEERDKTELNRYLESNLVKPAQGRSYLSRYRKV